MAWESDGENDGESDGESDSVSDGLREWWFERVMVWESDGESDGKSDGESDGGNEQKMMGEYGKSHIHQKYLKKTDSSFFPNANSFLVSVFKRFLT